MKSLFIVLSAFVLTVKAICPYPGQRTLQLLNLNLTESDICLHNGYSESEHASLFYWLFSKDSNVNSTKPLTIYFNDGHGSSSILSIFSNGPLALESSGDIVLKSQSWLNETNLLYFDYPFNNGFSLLKNPYQVDFSKELLNILTTVNQTYPLLFQNGIILAGETHSTKYVTSIAELLLQISATFTLKGIVLTNPIIDIVQQRKHIYSQSFDHGTLDLQHLPQVEVLQRRCEQSYTSNVVTAYKQCQQVIDYLQLIEGNLLQQHGSLKREDIDQLQLTLRNQTLVQQFKLANDNSYLRLQDPAQYSINFVNKEEASEIKQRLSQLLNHPIPLLILMDSQSFALNLQDTEELINNLDFKFQKYYSTQSRSYYYYADAQNRTQLGGYFKKLYPLHFFIARDSPLEANMDLNLQLLRDFITHNTLSCHHPDVSQCYSNQQLCQTFMNNCNDHGLCLNNGQCFCYHGYHGADCSIRFNTNQVVQIIDLRPNQAEYLQLNKTQMGEQNILLSGGQNELKVYISTDGVPSKTNYVFKAKAKQVSIDTRMFESEIMRVALVNANTELPANVDLKYTALNQLEGAIVKQNQTSAVFFGLALVAGVFGLVNLVMYLNMRKQRQDMEHKFVNI